MKKIITTALLIFTAMICNAQNWELKVNAGGNTTFVDGIQGLVVFGKSSSKLPWEDLDNGTDGAFVGQFGTDQVSTSNKLGFYADAELVRHLGKNWAISVSAGINKTNYTYDIPFMSSPGVPDTVSMKTIDDDFGDTKLVYVSSRFLNIKKSFSSLSLSAGPVLNFLVHDNGQGKVYYRDNGDNTVNYIASPLAKPNKFLYGGNLALGYQLARPLEIKAGVQYFFNSVYKKGENQEGFENPKDVLVNPLQLTLGLSYSIMKF